MFTEKASCINAFVRLSVFWSPHFVMRLIGGARKSGAGSESI